MIVPVGATNQTELQTLDLGTILQRLGRTYSAMTVYRDRGVSTVQYSRSPELDITQRFATEFERAKHFSWVSDLGKKNDYRITFDGLRVVERFYGRQEEVPTLGDAIASATGISHIAATWVPTLLMPEMLPGTGILPTFRRASLATRLPDDQAGGQRCFLLRAQDSRLEVRVWIGTRDFLVRRIEHRSLGRDAITTTDYTPQTDIALTP